MLTPDTTGSGGSVLKMSVSDTLKSEVREASASYSVSEVRPDSLTSALSVVLVVS